MKTFEVRISGTAYAYLEVKAVSEEQATEKVEHLLETYSVMDLFKNSLIGHDDIEIGVMGEDDTEIESIDEITE